MSANTPSSRILVVDDDEVVLRTVGRVLRHQGYLVDTCADPREVAGLLAAKPYALMLLDLAMPHLDGSAVLAETVQRFPGVAVVVVTADQDARSVVQCMKAGAADYLVKPVRAEELVATVTKTLEQQAVREENARLRAHFLDLELENPSAFAAIVTGDPVMLRMFAYLEAVARGTQPVLVLGETGTGKELVARALHVTGGRSGPFVAVNVAGLDDAVFSDTLFGHRAGAFTGAIKDRAGMVEAAGSGTLFLDEIGDLPEASQVKLLRLVQEREYLPLGSDTPRRLRARVIAATHRDPTRLRQDLYFRLRSYQVRVPPLRERTGDLPLLIAKFVRDAADDLGVPAPEVPAELPAQLARHAFPGNVRELQAVLHDAVARQRNGTIAVDAVLELVGLQRDVAGAFATPSAGLAAAHAPPADRPIFTRSDWRRLERENILAALERTGWQVAAAGGAAELLGMRPSTLTSRMKALGIRRPARG